MQLSDTKLRNKLSEVMLSSDHKITIEHSQNVFEILYSPHRCIARLYAYVGCEVQLFRRKDKH